MTAKRDFKRRVRQRQARTGESYVTARRHLLASHTAAREPPGGDAEDAASVTSVSGPAVSGESDGRDGGSEHDGGEEHDDGGDGAGGGEGDDGEGGSGDHGGGSTPARGIPVVELIDVSDEAKRVGLVCRIVMFPSLADRVAPAVVLARLRELLLATVGDPATALVSRLALTGEVRRRDNQAAVNVDALRLLLQRARAGLGGMLEDGATLAFHIAAGDAMIPILCTLSARDTALELSAIDDLVPERWSPLAPLIEPQRYRLGNDQHRRLVTEALTGSLDRAILMGTPRPALFVIYDGRRYRVTRNEFVIGRSPAAADLAIKDGNASRKHAAVFQRNGVYYLKDLGSTNGIAYKGMLIDNKRIEEGDVFQIGHTEIGFTFQGE